MKTAWQRISTALRIAIGAALLFYLFRQAGEASLHQAFAHAASRWPWFFAGAAMTLAGLCAGAVRWAAILSAQGFSFPRSKVLHIFFIGQFFNAFMLGACGGDVARAFYVARGQEGRRTEAITTILMDRGIGLFSMILFCCLMIPLRLHIFLDNSGPRHAGIIMLVFLACALTGIIVFFRKNVFEHSPLFQRLEKGTKLGPLLRKAYEAFFTLLRQRSLLRESLALSFVSMVFLTLACWCLAQSLELDVPLVDYFLLFPIISVLMSVPITPGSLGVREGLFVSLFGAVMVDKPDAILLSLMVYAGGVLWSLAGGLVYILFTPRAERHFPTSDEIA